MAEVITPVEIEKQARIAIIKVLKEAGFADGASMTSQELEQEKKPVFWENILKEDIAKKKSFYLVFTIGLHNSNYADNDSNFTYTDISIDIFTSNEISSQQTYNMRLKLEKAFKSEKSFDYFKLLAKFFDQNLNLNQISYNVKKRYSYE